MSPTAAKRVCTSPGCGAFQPCPVHRPSRVHDQQRGHARARGYSRRWEARAAAFKGKYPLCGMRPDDQAPVMSRCAELGLVTPGEHVDHMVPHKGDQGLFWDERGNWQTLCRACHSRKTQAGL